MNGRRGTNSTYSSSTEARPPLRPRASFTQPGHHRFPRSVLVSRTEQVASFRGPAPTKPVPEAPPPAFPLQHLTACTWESSCCTAGRRNSRSPSAKRSRPVGPATGVPAPDTAAEPAAAITSCPDARKPAARAAGNCGAPRSAARGRLGRPSARHGDSWEMESSESRGRAWPGLEPSGNCSSFVGLKGAGSRLRSPQEPWFWMGYF